LIELTNIRKHFILGNQRIDVVQGIDLTIKAGEFIAIMGKSGSGKSTLLNIIGCLDRPSMGSYRLFGNDVARMSDRQLSSIRSHQIGFIFQSFNLIAKNSAIENIEKPLIYQGIGSKIRNAKARNVLCRMGLSDRAHHLPSQLSGGQQQRVAVARALVTNPNLLIADEPTGNLDSNTSAEIMRLLRKLCDEGRTVVMVTHDPSAAEFSDRVVYMRDGVLSHD